MQHAICECARGPPRPAVPCLPGLCLHSMGALSKGDSGSPAALSYSTPISKPRPSPAVPHAAPHPPAWQRRPAQTHIRPTLSAHSPSQGESWFLWQPPAPTTAAAAPQTLQCRQGRLALEAHWTKISKASAFSAASAADCHTLQSTRDGAIPPQGPPQRALQQAHEVEDCGSPACSACSIQTSLPPRRCAYVDNMLPVPSHSVDAKIHLRWRLPWRSKAVSMHSKCAHAAQKC